MQSPNRTIWLLLSYLWIAVCCVVLPAIPLVAEREDDFAKWHAKHGLILAIAWLIVSVVLLGVGGLLGLAWAPLGILFRIFWAITGMAFLVICAVALMKGLEGQRWTIKLIEGFLGKLNSPGAGAPPAGGGGAPPPGGYPPQQQAPPHPQTGWE